MAVADLLAQAVDNGRVAFGDFVGLLTGSPLHAIGAGCAVIGFGLTLAGAFARTMLPLRWLAVASNVALLVYGALAPAMVPFVTALVLLPVNVWRAFEITRLTRRVSRAQVTADMAGLWLRPYMKSRKLAAGATLFRRGDTADRLFLLVDGVLELVEIGTALPPGRIFGEIALFSPDHARTHTARCTSDCTILEIDETTVRELYFQHPDFAFHLMNLLAGRLTADVARQAVR